MKQYDKIYVHCHSMQSNLEIVLEPGECGKSVKRVDNVLVMTIEELREIWDAATDHQMENQRLPGPCNLKTPGFHTYLTSKGITL